MNQGHTMHRTPTPRFRRSQLAAAVLALASITAAHASPPTTAPKYASASHASTTTTQLPRGVTPLHYIVSITPDAAAATFKGEAAIKVAVDTPTASITFNALNLAFTAAAIEGAGGSKQVTRKIEFDADQQTATVHFAQPVARGEYLLRIDYSGKIGTQATGLFSLDYDTPEGRQRALYTQFENSDARSVLPSWDEPDYKATFALDVVVPS